ncbi:bifunctional folylpolyglutamate synthase/dihydrofolate synthase [Porifericola rhodea]|uniref:bifunctional folylpolyglutamate synthase/dihydrofolate synthase n=1 Tax=Porifericola rhodea TaxID=930972 RepID=UPI002666B1A4|nr:folylpolyglutamate synthase/dihydrofolate synthase family protein [Porifericola rhodea]WKN31533.1 bifunctional folylpolyglutamate synthase/dihydrofolate synthase [Porifericola rhodea]
MFQRIGNTAFKKDLSNTLAFCEQLGNPQHKFPSVHIAGTNGKGSSAHSIAAILQTAGYKTGLYTSPHLKAFTERIKINGIEIDQKSVVSFVEEYQSFMEALRPSFFETTVAMAFDYFATQEVDIAIIEVGMGGRFDSTNVIKPLLSLITHIGYDHMAFLGDTLDKIAFEKGGVIKANTPVVIGEKQDETSPVFEELAIDRKAMLYYAQNFYRAEIAGVVDAKYSVNIFHDSVLAFENLSLSLGAHYQLKNLPGILKSIDILKEKGYTIGNDDIRRGLGEVSTLTGLKGRWQILHKKPLVICDTGHNKGALLEIRQQLQHLQYDKLYIVFGTSEEKDPAELLSLMPQEAYYIFCKADLPRAMGVEKLTSCAKNLGLSSEESSSVMDAFKKAKALAQGNDCIFVGGSTFVVAEIDDL